MKIFFRRIHLYLSLAAGLVIATACLTGAILVFEKEWQMSANKQRYYITVNGQRLSSTELVQKIKDSFPKARISSIKFYADEKRSAEVNITLPQKETGNKEASKQAQGRQPGFTVFINPYTGAILEKYSYREIFFYKVFALHRWLLGGENSLGKLIVGISTFIFLFILITGVILWWPKTKKILQQRLTIKWDANWKRLNHDLHLVFGFYSCIFLFIIAFTGLAWSFEWFNKGIYTITHSPMKNPLPPRSTFVAGQKPAAPDTIFAQAKSINPTAIFYTVSFPKDSADVYALSVLPGNAPHESATDVFYFDQYSGKKAGQLLYANRSTGARVRSVFKPIHTGSIWGWPSKIVALIVCLFGVSFPVTGYIMWWNRTKKNTGRQENLISKKRDNC